MVVWDRSDIIVTGYLEVIVASQKTAQICTHLDQIREVTPSVNGCEECRKWKKVR